MGTPMERARELVGDIVFGLGAGAPYILAQDARRIAAIAAAGLALRDRCHHGDGGPGPDCECPMCAFDAAVAKAMAESEGE